MVDSSAGRIAAMFETDLNFVVKYVFKISELKLKTTVRQNIPTDTKVAVREINPLLPILHKLSVTRNFFFTWRDQVILEQLQRWKIRLQKWI